MSVQQVVDLLQSAGGYGVAGLMWWFWKQERTERQRYRDLFENTLKELPLLTEALRDLTNEVARRNQTSVPPGAE